MKDPVRILFWFIKKSGEVLDKLKARDFKAIKLSETHFSFRNS